MKFKCKLETGTTVIAPSGMYNGDRKGYELVLCPSGGAEVNIWKQGDLTDTVRVVEMEAVFDIRMPKH